MYKTVVNTINQGLGAVAVIFIVIMMVSITADVSGRYLFNSPILGTTELNRTLLVYVVCFALGYTELRKRHIRVEMVLSRLPLKAKTLVEGLELLLALVLIGFATYATSVIAYNATVQGEYETGIINFPMWPGRIALAVGCLMLCMQYVVGIVDSFRSFLSRVNLKGHSEWTP
jgi:TRAP-type C4-dicarboxylate transport system permease small subunit